MTRSRNPKELARPKNLWQVLQGEEQKFNSFPLHMALWFYKNFLSGETGAFKYLPGPVMFLPSSPSPKEPLLNDVPSIYLEDPKPYNKHWTFWCLAWLLCLPALDKGPMRPGKSDKACQKLGEGHAHWADLDADPQEIAKDLAKDWLESIAFPMDKSIEGSLPAPTRKGLGAVALIRALTFEHLFGPLEYTLGYTPRGHLPMRDLRNASPIGPYDALDYAHRAMQSVVPEMKKEEMAALNRQGRGKLPSFSYTLPYRGLPIFDDRKLLRETTRLLWSDKLMRDNREKMTEDEWGQRREIKSDCPFMAITDWEALEKCWKGKEKRTRRAPWKWLSKIYGIPVTALCSGHILSANS